MSHPSQCDHECPPHPRYVLQESYALNPAGASSPSIVPCTKCGAPINRGRFTGLTMETPLPSPDEQATPGRYADESVYSNFDHELDDAVVRELEADPEGVHAQHAAWNFCGYVWKGTDNRWHEQVWQYHSLLETRTADDLAELIADVNDTYGRD